MEGHSFNSSVYMGKKEIKVVYSNRDDGITTDDFINMSEDSLENLFKD